MKLFKNYSLLMMLMIAASATLFTGCVEDPCADTICFNNGTCDEVTGTCNCTGNFTGPTCEDCPSGFVGDNCDECATGFAGDNCDECAVGFTGVNCDECDAGYEGTDCGTLSRDKFIGTYEVNENCILNGVENPATFTSVIAGGTNANEISISNFWELFMTPVVATVDGENIVIALQDPDGDGFEVQGTGVYNAADNRIEITYVVTDTVYGDSYSCLAWYPF